MKIGGTLDVNQNMTVYSRKEDANGNHVVTLIRGDLNSHCAAMFDVTYASSSKYVTSVVMTGEYDMTNGQVTKYKIPYELDPGTQQIITIV